VGTNVTLDHGKGTAPEREPAIAVTPFVEADRAGCAAVLARLPHWFGFPNTNAEYIAGLGRMPAWVARREGAIAGFIAVEQRTAAAAEIVVLAVAPELHRAGIGSGLLAMAERWLREQGLQYVYLLTLGPSDPDEGYAKTRAFYAARGFAPLFESTAFWGEAQPALVLLKPLR
jgi:GNAT superfamily N-acetyltransferase